MPERRSPKFPLIFALGFAAALGAPSAASDAAQFHERVLVRFQGNLDAAYPSSGLVADASGSLYGISTYGGGVVCSGPYWSGCGTVFKLTRAGSGYAESILYRFQGGPDGKYPAGPLVIDANGVLYGTAQLGGAGRGTIFRLTPTASGYAFDVIYAFTGANDAASPLGLIVDATGTFYGTSYSGGEAACGTVYRLAPALTAGGTGYVETVLYSFLGSSPLSGTCYSRKLDGSFPSAGIVEDQSGTLYGTTTAGGSEKCSTLGCGTAFALTPSPSGYIESILFRFARVVLNGAEPGALLLDATGAFYGTTTRGGSARYRQHDGYGTVFRLSRSASRYTMRTLHRFRGEMGGASPNASLIATAGSLFGTTAAGGGVGACATEGGCGTLFELSPDAYGQYREHILYRFLGGFDGSLPLTPLLSLGGTLYGTTSFGGGSKMCPHTPGCGTVFALSATP
jgi:uncharacterized repeat protein (TIGR03803 family)